MRRIAIEEAFATPELLQEWRKLLAGEKHGYDSAFESIYRPLLNNPAMEQLRNKLVDVDDLRIADMDKYGIDIQVLSLTAPGVQVFDRKKSNQLCIESNHYLVDVLDRHPNRFYGLLAVSPIDPEFSAREIQRASRHENIVGIIINSHTRGAYLDSEVYNPIFEAAQELALPIYLHPSTPSDAMAEPFLKYGLEGPIWGFAADAGLHAMRLMLCGVFDRFPKLQIILGHMGEGLPFWFSRIAGRISLSEAFDKSGKVKKLQRQPSHYFDSNFYYSTSGMNNGPVLRYMREACDIARVMFAIDYPYESTEEAVSGLEQADITRKEKDMIFSENAVRAFDNSFQ